MRTTSSERRSLDSRSDIEKLQDLRIRVVLSAQEYRRRHYTREQWLVEISAVPETSAISAELVHVAALVFGKNGLLARGG